MKNRVQTILLPEFVLGAIEYSGSKITGFTPNERYKNEHDYLGDGLVFPNTVLYDYYNKTGIKRVAKGFENRDLQDAQDEQITQAIIKECNEYEIARRQGKNARTENEIKEFSLRKMLKSSFKIFLEELKNFFKGKDNSKER